MKYYAERAVRSGPPSWARLSLAVAVLARRHAQASHYLERVFGRDSGAVLALRSRVQALQQAALQIDQQGYAERLHTLVVWLAAVAETIELENRDAAELRVLLNDILKECEFLVSAATSAAA